MPPFSHNASRRTKIRHLDCGGSSLRFHSAPIITLSGEVAQLCWQQQGELDEGRHLAHERGCLLRVSLFVFGGKPKEKIRTPITFAWAGRGASSTHTASGPAGLCILPGFGSWAAQHIRRCHAKGRIGIAGPGLKFMFFFSFSFFSLGALDSACSRDASLWACTPCGEGNRVDGLLAFACWQNLLAESTC